MSGSSRRYPLLQRDKLYPAPSCRGKSPVSLGMARRAERQVRQSAGELSGCSRGTTPRRALIGARGAACVAAVGFVWPRSMREISPWLMPETAASCLWVSLPVRPCLDSPLTNPPNRSIVIGNVRPDRTISVERLPTCAPESRADNADVMPAWRRSGRGLPGLLARSRASPHAFADFYEQLSPQVLRFFAARTGDPHRAVDLTAETFARAFEHRRDFRGASDEQAAAWLWKIARNELAGHRRSRAVEARRRAAARA